MIQYRYVCGGPDSIYNHVFRGETRSFRVNETRSKPWHQQIQLTPLFRKKSETKKMWTDHAPKCINLIDNRVVKDEQSQKVVITGRCCQFCTQ